MAIAEPMLDSAIDNYLGDNLMGDIAKFSLGAWISGSKTPAVKVAGVSLAVLGMRDGIKKVMGGGLSSFSLSGLLGGTTNTSSTNATFIQ